MLMYFIKFLLFSFLVWTTTASAEERILITGKRGYVASVVDGDTVILRDPINEANQIRLVGLQAPKLPLGRRGFKAWPLGKESKLALERLVLGKTIILKYGGRRMDRHGRILAHLFLDDGRWVQEEMLRTGMARVYSFPDNRAKVMEMYQFEQAARSQNKGIWGLPYYTVRNHESLEEDIGTFQVITGRVLNVAKVKGRTYINFGENWRTDFTITISSKNNKAFIRNKFNPLDLKDRSIRVRGWLRKRNGAQIDATHPEQIEFLK
jgi:micrococcal nuclease